MSDKSSVPVSWGEALSFWWHSYVKRHHAESVYYDAPRNLVRCGRCGRKWGDGE